MPGAGPALSSVMSPRPRPRSAQPVAAVVSTPGVPGGCAGACDGLGPPGGDWSRSVVAKPPQSPVGQVFSVHGHTRSLTGFRGSIQTGATRHKSLRRLAQRAPHRARPPASQPAPLCAWFPLRRAPMFLVTLNPGHFIYFFRAWLI